MIMRDLKCVVIASTGGSVMNQLLSNSFFRRQIVAVVSDRQCGALEKAEKHGVPTLVLAEAHKAHFSERLLQTLNSLQADYAISFYTKLFVGDLLEAYRNRILNLHPSLLPAFKGLHAFEDAAAYGARYVGSTIHFIDDKMDEGRIIQQTISANIPGEDPARLRHRIFVQQCRSLLQVVRWLAEDRVRIENDRVCVANAKYVDLEYSPNLDFSEAVDMQIPDLCRL